jgi:hypothetical protein
MKGTLYRFLFCFMPEAYLRWHSGLIWQHTGQMRRKGNGTKTGVYMWDVYV